MRIIKKIDLLYKEIIILKQLNKKIALIPTMGNLHDGHIELILSSKKYAEITIVSIFINPMQFNCIFDLKKYPRTFKQDCKILKKHNVDIVFFPNTDEMYPNEIKNHTYVDVPKLSKILEGKSRPGHFKGVVTIISKLFNLIQPNYAFFGEKDYQQLLVIKTFVQELNYAIQIISIPIIRLKNGLAFSSRNNNLSAKEMKIAPYLYKIIKYTHNKILIQDYKYRKNILTESRNLLIRKGFIIDIYNRYDYNSLHAPSKKNQKLIILASVWLGKTRLIDNKTITLINK